jgi:glycosyltransferase involved in cell wall biosynthesis
MKEIKVFLRLSKKFHPSNYEIIEFPPKGVKYIHRNFTNSKKNKAKFLHKIKNILWRRYLKNNPAAIKIEPHGADLIYSTNNIMNTGKNPWIMDVENIMGLFAFDPKKLRNRKYFHRVKRILLSNSCKKLMPYTEAAKKSIIHGGLKELESKMEVVYLAKRSVEDFKKPRNKVPVILWVGRRFWEKGGMAVLKVFDEIKDKAKFKLVMRGPVPENIKEKYKEYKNIEFSDTRDYISDNIWEDLYKKADIFLYPTNLDSFGNALLDAMNYKAAVVTSGIFSTPEIIQDKKTGFVVDHPMKWHDDNFQMIYPSFNYFVEKTKSLNNKKYIKELSEKVLILIKDEKLRKTMGEKGHKEIKEGKFSIKERNKKFKKIYEEAIKK